ncbi:pilus assembly protein TadG-related protein [Prosthecomicrobium hirschii]|uniref:pilus assembly protein TadG-related protein n=1 Tax=Prosthecodimorpha hirschii TaxID=665126 RepID=UPI001364CB88|nr:pilus assembly protein TadG-related protein [Prosthecomicrobium hirschii]
MTTFALCAPLIIGLSGYVVDKAVWQAQRFALQDVADTASLVAARTLATDRSHSPEARVAAAQADAARTVFAARPDLTPSITVSRDGRTVTVGLVERGMVSFAGVFGAQPVDLAVTGHAIVDRNAETACRIDKSADHACRSTGSIANLAPPEPAVLMPFARLGP